MAGVKSCHANGAQRKCKRLSERLYYQPVAAGMINQTARHGQTPARREADAGLQAGGQGWGG